MRIGIFGGTFDPPHIGHQVLAIETYHQLALNKLLWVLTPSPPHKPNRTITPLEYRVKMVQATVGDEPGFEFSRVEIDRPPPHFAVDTVENLREQFPAGHLVYLLGEDSLRDLPLWREARKFVTMTDTLAVMPRPAASPDLAVLERDLPGLREKLHFIDAPLLQISSTDIRHRAKEGRPYRYLLPPAVYAIIRRYGLYGLRGGD
ncbi:MAG: Nicotinate-nucleotide adenylyltransferase [Chloroflexi bacterium]|nr:Nicotinate-nucleotide adenylyltransferase [Chloroflexota bacterium]